jgi:hypothetical protein
MLGYELGGDVRALRSPQTSWIWLVQTSFDFSTDRYWRVGCIPGVGAYYGYMISFPRIWGVGVLLSLFYFSVLLYINKPSRQSESHIHLSGLRFIIDLMVIPRLLTNIPGRSTINLNLTCNVPLSKRSFHHILCTRVHRMQMLRTSEAKLIASTMPGHETVKF